MWIGSKFYCEKLSFHKDISLSIDDEARNFNGFKVIFYHCFDVRIWEMFIGNVYMVFMIQNDGKTV